MILQLILRQDPKSYGVPLWWRGHIEYYREYPVVVCDDGLRDVYAVPANVQMLEVTFHENQPSGEDWGELSYCPDRPFAEGHGLSDYNQSAARMLEQRGMKYFTIRY